MNAYCFLFVLCHFPIIAPITQTVPNNNATFEVFNRILKKINDVDIKISTSNTFQEKNGLKSIIIELFVVQCRKMTQEWSAHLQFIL